MQDSAREAYLRTQVMTATPQKLQLMLIEGALRYGQQAQEHLANEDLEQAGEAMIRCQEIVAELLGNVAGSESEVSRKLAGIYVYLFQTLGQALLSLDAKPLEDVLGVLEIERETWHQVCKKFGAERTDEAPALPNATQPADSNTPPSHAPLLAPPGVNPLFDAPPSGGVSFEA